ncbi:hypothetical protein [Streptomyces hawaiiensis]|uniref:hypothetical protein n=1 Tax=Streptomyces hawaiiensis TaxID=67305 RepID=UPI001586C333|nr:hypothetical protein [Streptomyces hawaiiensis]
MQLFKGIQGFGAAATVAALAGSMLFTGTGTAQAASGCAGTKIDHVSFDTGWADLYYSNGYNCAVATSRTPGVKLRMKVWIEVLGGTKVTDSGYYTQYAGPVKIYAAGSCVRFGGEIGTTGDNTDWGHCG